VCTFAIVLISAPGDRIFFLVMCWGLGNKQTARRQEIIKMTEQLIEAINNGDFDAYT
jgi:Calcium/calmodulin dependent protein kinase II association domain